ncbi:hypothetical protein WG936_04030 [Corynebacterium sp. H127]|uniref:hypothetical protein n=1 Tax=Corynebacterium sp. H127 TaxID=3133418 RepID=UPI0030ADBBC6
MSSEIIGPYAQASVLIRLRNSQIYEQELKVWTRLHYWHSRKKRHEAFQCL